MPDLRFSLPAGGSNPDLVFGENTPPASVRADVNLPLPGLNGGVRFGSVVHASAQIHMPGLVIRTRANWDLAVQRPVVGSVRVESQSCAPSSVLVMQVEHQGLPVLSGSSVCFQGGLKVSLGSGVGYSDANRLSVRKSMEWQSAGQAIRECQVLWGVSAVLRSGAELFADSGLSVKTSAVITSESAVLVRVGVVVNYDQAVRIEFWLASKFHGATQSGYWLSGRHQDALKPLIAFFSDTDTPVPPGPIPVGPDLLFCHGLHTSALLFGKKCRSDVWPPATIAIPTRSAYIVLNDVVLRRMDGGMVFPPLDLSLSIDADSWVWGWSATLPRECLDAVMPDPEKVVLEALVNGTRFALMVEKINHTREFGKERIRIGSRGVAALLSDPSAPLMNYGNPDYDMTAQQLAIAAITAPGLPLGWSIDWGLDDWLVPRGVWSHHGSPISAVSRVAEAAGGYVQADPYNQVLHVLRRYPVAPWSWGGITPDIEIPEAVTVTEDLEYLDKPDYNRVFISGQAGGILGQVTRSGTAGDLVAPMVTDPLITHAYAARQRGIAILGDTGQQIIKTVSMPVLGDSGGVITPGTLAKFVSESGARVGIVRGVSVQCGYPKVRQTIEVETHGY